MIENQTVGGIASGGIKNWAGGTITNASGSFVRYRLGVLENEGTITNNGSMDFRVDSTFTNENMLTSPSNTGPVATIFQCQKNLLKEATISDVPVDEINIVPATDATLWQAHCE